MSRESDSFEHDPQSRYDDALLCANWNPVIELLGASGMASSPRTRGRSGSNLSDEEANAFLSRVYASGA